MKGRVISDWTRADFSTPQGRALIIDAVSHFTRAADVNPEVRAAIAHFGTKADGPAKIREILEKFHLEGAADQAWRAFFTVRDYTSTNQDGFKLRDVGSGLTFRLIPEGGEVKIAKMAGEDVEVAFSMYGGGLGWHRTLIDDRDWWTLEDNAISFRNKWLAKQAAIGCALIEALGAGQNQAWSAPTPAALANTDSRYVAIRDANTINDACVGILTDLKAAGYDVAPGVAFTVLAPIQLRNRISAAMALTSTSVAGSPAAVQWNVTPVYTLELSATNKYYVGIPGMKSIIGVRMNLTIFDQFDPKTYSDIAVGWARLGGAIGEVKQIRRCSIA